MTVIIAAQRATPRRLRALDELHLLLTTPLKQTLAAFLHAHPYTYDHISGLAARLSYTREEVELAVEALAAAGVLLKMGKGEFALYALNTHDDWQYALRLYFSQYPPNEHPLATLRCSLLAAIPASAS